MSVLKKICDHPALLSQRAAALVVSGGAKWVDKKAKMHDSPFKGKAERAGKSKHKSRGRNLDAFEDDSSSGEC